MLCYRPNSEVYYGIALTSLGDIGMDRKDRPGDFIFVELRT